MNIWIFFVYLVAAVVSVVVLYFTIRKAVISGMRVARHEQRVEEGYGGDVNWLDPAQSRVLLSMRQTENGSTGLKPSRDR